MAGTVNKVILLGRLTRDPETRSFQNGGGVVNFGFVVENPKKGADGKWEDVPVWLDCEAFKNAEGRGPASTIERFVKKGDRLHIFGHLKLDQWEDKSGGGKRSKIKIVVDHATLIEKKSDSGTSSAPSQPTQQPQQPSGYDDPGLPPDDYNADLPF